ncbi:hypothetical protein F5888DRAFT_1125636 [Russula emetica]|nr:hypothetical protein F5888DRAFT_1125636 [Russula emetica]
MSLANSQQPYRSTIGTDFITKTLPHHSQPDESVTLQVWDRHHHYASTAIAHTTIGYCRTKRVSSLSSAFFRGADAVILIFEDAARGRSFVRADLSAMRKWENTVLSLSEARPTSRLAQRGSAVSEGAALDFIDELVPLLGSPSSCLAAPEDERDWIPTQGPDCVSSGSDDEVVVHDNGSLESGAASPVDMILVDETHSASVLHHNDVGSDWENSIPTFAIPPRTPPTDFQSSP